MMCDSVDFAVRRCPFLAKVAQQNGYEYARGMALNPTETAEQGHGSSSPQQQEAALQSNFRLFHGPQGVVPLVAHKGAPGASGCPFHAAARPDALETGTSASVVKGTSKPHTQLPLATISLSGFGSGSHFGDFLRNKIQKQGGSNRRPHSHRQHPQQPASGSSSQAPGAGSGPCSSSSQHPASNPNNPGSFKPQRPLTDPSGGSGLGPSQRGFGPGFGPQPPSASSAPTASPAGPNAAGSLGTGAGGSSSTVNRGWSALGSSSSGSNGSISHFSSSTGSSAASASSPANSSRSSNNAGAWGSGPSRKLNPGSQPPSGGPNRGPGKGPRAPGGGGSSNSSSKITGGSSSSSAASSCPLRKWLGPMAGLVFNEYDKLVCPPPIVAARAALAKTAAVQQLRPQKLPVKLVAVAAVAAAANLPCGAVREHFEKFSFGWFMAVHATIPFVAMLRKAVIMPKYAMLVTFTAAVLGQVIGSRLERARLQQLQQQGLADPLQFLGHSRSSSSVPAAAAAAAAPASAVAGSSVDSSVRPVKGARGQQKMQTGGSADFALGQQRTATAGGACRNEVAGAVVGLGNFLAQLPVVKAQ